MSQCSCIAFGVQTFLLLFDAITLSQISLAVVSEKLGGWQRGHVHTYISGKVAEKHYYVYVVLSYDSPWPHEEGSRTAAKRRASCIMYQLSDGTKCTLSRWHQTKRRGWYARGLCWHPDKPCQAGEMGLQEPLKIQQGEAQSAAPWEEQPQAAVLEVLVDTKLNMS